MKQYWTVVLVSLVALSSYVSRVASHECVSPIQWRTCDIRGRPAAIRDNLSRSQPLNISSDDFDFQIRRKLENGELLSAEDWTFFRVSYNCSQGAPTRVVVTGTNPFPDSDLRLYFANSEKNILEVILTCNERMNLVGYVYDHPYGHSTRLVGQPFVNVKGNFSAEIPANWFPRDISRISASSKLGDGTILNYYGINNFEISLPDTMVVEEFKKFLFC